MSKREAYKDCKLFVLENHESPDVEVYNNCVEDSKSPHKHKNHWDIYLLKEHNKSTFLKTTWPGHY